MADDLIDRHPMVCTRTSHCGFSTICCIPFGSKATNWRSSVFSISTRNRTRQGQPRRLRRGAADDSRLRHDRRPDRIVANSRYTARYLEAVYGDPSGTWSIPGSPSTRLRTSLHPVRSCFRWVNCGGTSACVSPSRRYAMSTMSTFTSSDQVPRRKICVRLPIGSASRIVSLSFRA